MPATTTRMPRIVGYQRSFGMFSVGWAWARRDVITASGSRALEATLVVDDRLDLLLGQGVAEVRHAARRDPARAVQLVGGLARRDPFDLVLDALRARELTQRVAASEVGAVGATALRTGQRPRSGIVRIVEGPVLRVAPRALQLEEQFPVVLARVLRPLVLELLREPLLGLLGRDLNALDVVHEIVDALLVEHALAARDAPGGHGRARSAVRDDVVHLFLVVPQHRHVQRRRLPGDLDREAIARGIGGHRRGRVAAGVVRLDRVVRTATRAVDTVAVRAQQRARRVVFLALVVREQDRTPFDRLVLELLLRVRLSRPLEDVVGEQRQGDERGREHGDPQHPLELAALGRLVRQERGEVLRWARFRVPAKDEDPPQEDGPDRRERRQVDEDDDESEVHRVWTSDTGRPLGRLPRGVRADRRTLDERRSGGVDRDLAARHLEHESVEPTRRGPALLLTDAVVLRAVARALEPLRRLAPRHPAAEVHALLVQRDVALLHAGDDARVVDGLRLVDVVLRVGRDVRAGGGVVEGQLLVELRLRVVLGPDDDLGAEAARAPRPEESEHRRAHSGGEDAEPGEDPAVEELPAREPQLLLLDGDVLDRSTRADGLERLARLLRPGARLLVELGQLRADGLGRRCLGRRHRAVALARLAAEPAGGRPATALGHDRDRGQDQQGGNGDDQNR